MAKTIIKKTTSAIKTSIVSYLFDLNDGGKRGTGGRYRTLQVQRPQWPEYQLEPRLFFTFNGRACFCADSQETSAQGQSPELSTEQTVLASGAFLSFRMNENASQETYKAHSCKKNFGSDRKFFKKITGQAYCKDSGPNGVNAFRDEFSSGVGCLDFCQPDLLVFVVESDVKVLEDVHSAQKKRGGIIFAKEASDGKLICGDFYGDFTNVYL